MKVRSLRDEFEDNNNGGFIKIYPCEDRDYYDTFVNTAKSIWESFTARPPLHVKRPISSVKSKSKLSLSRPTTAQSPSSRENGSSAIPSSPEMDKTSMWKKITSPSVNIERKKDSGKGRS